jgi:hypothetical protein
LPVNGSAPENTVMHLKGAVTIINKEEEKKTCIL